VCPRKDWRIPIGTLIEQNKHLGALGRCGKTLSREVENGFHLPLGQTVEHFHDFVDG
jgi:hypothetical protein